MHYTVNSVLSKVTINLGKKCIILRLQYCQESINENKQNNKLPGQWMTDVFYDFFMFYLNLNYQPLLQRSIQINY